MNENRYKRLYLVPVVLPLIVVQLVLLVVGFAVVCVAVLFQGSLEWLALAIAEIVGDTVLLEKYRRKRAIKAAIKEYATFTESVELAHDVSAETRQ